MSDAEKTSNMTGVSRAGWSEREKIAYLLVLCENEGKIDSKISNAPIPAGRTVIACKKMVYRLKEKHKEDIMKIKSGQPLDNGETSALFEPLKTPKKRKAKATDGDADATAEEEGSPKKKMATPRKSKGAVIKEELVKEEEQEEQETA